MGSVLDQDWFSGIGRFNKDGNPDDLIGGGMDWLGSNLGMGDRSFSSSVLGLPGRDLANASHRWDDEYMHSRDARAGTNGIAAILAAIYGGAAAAGSEGGAGAGGSGAGGAASDAPVWTDVNGLNVLEGDNVGGEAANTGLQTPSSFDPQSAMRLGKMLMSNGSTGDSSGLGGTPAAQKDISAPMLQTYHQWNTPQTGLGAMPTNYAAGGFTGGIGGYSDGGRLLRGPGDGTSDSIPATINGDQPARLADGEFVVPARIVSELGNGSTDAGARKLYSMMDRIEAKRRKIAMAGNSKAEGALPA